MDSRILYLDTLTEPIVRFRVVYMYIIVTMDKECSKTSFAFAIRRFITCLIVHGLHITLPAVTHSGMRRTTRSGRANRRRSWLKTVAVPVA